MLAYQLTFSQRDGQTISSFGFYINAPFASPVKAVADNAIAGIGAAIIHNDVAWLAHPGSQG